MLVIVLVVLVIAVALAVAAIVAPFLVILELIVVAGAAALVSRLHPRSRRRHAGGMGSPGQGGPTDQDRSTRTTTSEPPWVMRWESEPPVSVVPFVRDQLVRVLTGWGVTGEAAEPAQLVVTELLSNAVEHARAPIELTVGFLGESVRVDVRDATADPPREQPRDPWKERGRGLQLVEALSSRWGWADDAAGKTVWAEVPIGWPDP